MPIVDWRFPVILIIAMVLSLTMTYLQMRAYNVQLNRALRMANGEHLMLVSGRGRSMRGGAIVIAIVDIFTREVVYARAMTGASIFARFRDVPALLGPMTEAANRVRGKQFKAAVEMAMQQVKPATQPDACTASTKPNQTMRPIRRRLAANQTTAAVTGVKLPRLQPTQTRNH